METLSHFIESFGSRVKPIRAVAYQRLSNVDAVFVSKTSLVAKPMLTLMLRRQAMFFYSIFNFNRVTKRCLSLSLERAS